MQSSTKSETVPRPTGWGLISAISFTILVLIVLTWSTAAQGSRSSGTASESKNALASDSDATTTAEMPASAATDTKTVTMSIPLEEGAVIDVEAPPMGLKIEKWDGDDVLLIVERTKRVAPGDSKTTPFDPVNIHVTRKGKDVRIETTGGAGWEANGMDLSFRILLPSQRQIETSCGDTDDVARRLTGVLWRSFHEEAFKWLVR